MAYNSAYTGSQVDAAVGAVRQKETIWDGKQDELTGTEDQLVGFNSAGEATAVSKPTYTAADVGAMPAVSGGTTGQVLTKTETGQEWQDAPDGLPSGGEEGQVLTKTASGAQWDDVPSDIPAGGTQGQVLTKGDGETVTWSDPASGLPDGGTPGQMLYQGESGPEWGDKPVMYVNITGDEDSGYQADKTAQEIYEAVQNNIFVSALTQIAETSMGIPLYTAYSSGGNYYIAFSRTDGGSTIYASITNTVNGEHVYVSTTALPANSVAFTPGSTGLTAYNVQDAIEEVQGHIPTDYVPTSRTVNGKALSSNITLTADDVGARPDTWTPSAADVGALPTQTGTQGQLLGFTANNVVGAVAAPTADSLGAVPTSRTVNGQALSQNITLDAEDVGAIPPPTRLTVTLNASSWSGNSQTITVNGVITNTSAQDIDISCADRASADAWAAGGVWCSNPTTANRLTFTCTTPPTANINVRIRLWEVG